MRESSLEAMLLLAGLYAAHGKHGKARILLEGLREVAPDDPRVARLLVHALVMEGAFEQSLEVVSSLQSEAASEPGSDSDPDQACLLRLRASALWGLDRAQEAREALEKSTRYLKGGEA
jgi:hypothetical protein